MEFAICLVLCGLYLLIQMDEGGDQNKEEEQEQARHEVKGGNTE